MKIKFETISRVFFFVLVALLLWSHLAGAQPSNAPAATVNVLVNDKSTNTPPRLIAPNEALTFGLENIQVLNVTIFGEPAWQYVASLLYIFLAFYIAKFLDYLIHARLKKWAEKTETKLDDLLLDLLHGPTKVIAFVILLHWGLRLSPFLSKFLQVLIAISLTYLALKCVDMLMGYWKDCSREGVVDKAFDEMLFPVISKTAKAFLVVVAVLLTSDNLGLEIKSVLASLSIGGLALGLAAQDTLANLFGAVAVFVDKPFRIGDRIKLDTIEGDVESIGLRSTRVRHVEGYLVTIPNKTMGNAIVTNISRRPTIKSQVTIGVTYDTTTEKLKRALIIVEEIHKKHPLTHDVVITFNQFADSSLNIQIIHWSKAKTLKEHMSLIQDLNLTMKQRFEEEKIEFAYPSRTLYVKTDTNGKSELDGVKTLEPLKPLNR